MRQGRQRRCKAIDTLLQHHAVTHTIAIAITTCCSYSRPRVHMHGSNYMAQGQMQPCIAQRTPTRRPDCLPGSAGGQGVLSCSATKTPTALARPACRPMGGGGRNIPIKQSLSHCAWCFPVSGAAVQQAGGHGGRTQSEYSESSPSASGFARHCTPPRRPGPQPETPGPAGRCLELATNGIKIKKKKLPLSGVVSVEHEQ